MGHRPPGPVPPPPEPPRPWWHPPSWVDDEARWAVAVLEVAALDGYAELPVPARPVGSYAERLALARVWAAL